MTKKNASHYKMVLSVYDIDDYRTYFDVHPIRKVANEVNGYDCLLVGTRFGIGFIKNGQIIERPQYQLDVKGAVRCLEVLNVSDERAKKNIVMVDDVSCASLVKDIGVFQFEMRDGRVGRRYGFIAQDLEKVVDGVVADDSQGKKSVDTTQLLALAIGAIKELQVRVAGLEGIIKAQRGLGV